MSDIALGFHTKLQATAGVTAICGDRGWPTVPTPNPTLPCYVYNLISYIPEYSTVANPFAQAIIQVDCIAESRDTAESLRNAVRAAVNNFRGAMGSEQCHGCTVEAKYDDYTPPITGERLGWYIHSLDLRISFTES